MYTCKLSAPTYTHISCQPELATEMKCVPEKILLCASCSAVNTKCSWLAGWLLQYECTVNRYDYFSG